MSEKAQQQDPWVYLHSGKKFYYGHFTADDISLDDIVSHLTHSIRWIGATKTNFSIAEHSIYCDDLVCARFGKPLPDTSEAAYERFLQLRLFALLHDAHETYTGDWPTGLKLLFPEIKSLQDAIDTVLWESFSLSDVYDEEMKKSIWRADKLALLGEARAFMPLTCYVELLQIYGMNPPEIIPEQYGDVAEMEMKNRVLFLCEYLMGLRDGEDTEGTEESSTLSETKSGERAAGKQVVEKAGKSAKGKKGKSPPADS